MNETNRVPRIAIATEEKYTIHHWEDDRVLAEALCQKGNEVDILNWRDPHSWTAYDAIFVSSTWDIPAHPDEFIQWIESCSADRQRFINDKDLLIANVIKSRYLHVLQKEFGDDISAGHAITPSLFYARNADAANHTNAVGGRSLEDLLLEVDKKAGWTGKDIILKPIVSADGNHTYIYPRTGKDFPFIGDAAAVLDTTRAQEAFDTILDYPGSKGLILQPYISGVEEGEYSLVFFNEDFSHAVRKPNGFKQAASYGRSPVEEKDLPTGMAGFAQKIIRYTRSTYGEQSLTRARIDLWKGEKGWVLGEMEATEPNTNLQRFKGVQYEAILARYAQAVYNRAMELMKK
jgi:hypothetical protein